MSRESIDQTFRQIRTLYVLGAVGGLTDSQLIERFLRGDGSDREDAFAALVARHGPMVLSVCRRMLRRSADVEDAFQAVFFVLARKAGALRRVEGLKSWLYGVAVRTAKAARRRSARQRRREGGAMDETRAVSLPDEGQGELLDLRDLLDEEIDRLPGRYREAVLLCELEGASRQDAARLLGLPEGTLSSRLARSRTLLRDRLSKRGVTLGAGAIGAFTSGSASASLPEPLFHSTVTLALQFAAGGIAAGTVPAAVSSLAEGVLAMIFTARLKLVMSTLVVLGTAACLTAGLAWAFGRKPGRETSAALLPAAVAAAPDAEPDAKSTTRGTQVRGVVVDEAGRPVAGAEVLADPFRATEARGVTGADGLFTIPIPHRQVDGTAMLAHSAGGRQAGVFHYDYNLTEEAARAPARIVVKPGKEVMVHVTDANRLPVADAAVEAAGMIAVLDHARTGRDGSARLLVPTDARVEWIYALRSALGFDYAEYGQIDERGRTRGGAPATDLPGSVNRTLDGVRTARIRALDPGGKPLAGAGFSVWLIHKQGRRSDVNVPSRLLSAVSGPDGVALFDWLPPTKDVLQFWPVNKSYASRRVIVEERQTEPVAAKLLRSETIRGRVVRPDGSPAPGIEVHAYGTGRGLDHGQDRTRTAADGTYELSISPGEAYAVYVDDKDWAAPSRLDVVVREGKPVGSVDFRLGRGTNLRGTVTIGKDNRPAPNQFIRLDETGESAPKDLIDKSDRFTAREVRRQWGTTTDAAGHYSIRVGPGTYTLMGPPRTENEKITIEAQRELVRDFRMPRPEKGTLTGRVVQAGAKDQGVGGARVEIAAANMLAIPFSVTADAQGRFHAERTLDPLVICAMSPDQTHGAIVETGAEDPEVLIAISPTATATGLLLDEQGKPAANQQLTWGRRVYLDEEQRVSMICFAPKVVTDSAGKFVLTSLVVGQEYEIAVQRENRYPQAGAVRPEKAGPIDLGTLRIGAYRSPSAAVLSSFRKNAPGPGAVAPAIDATTLEGKPLKLGDFKGRYVLLDFWATWCGPCIAEIPQLQAIHDAFGKDDRFAILSLSVDEKIDEPRKFQAKRKLPWSQAFLGGGIQGPNPGSFGVEAIPAFVLVGPDGKIVARGMRGGDIKKAVAKALEMTP